MTCNTSVASCAATSTVMAPAMNAAVMTGALSTTHNTSFYESNDDEFYGSINVNLKGTKTELKEAKGWLAKIFVGDKKWEEETLTQAEYLKRMYDVLSELGYKNVLYLDLNGNTVYDDEENKDDDLETALQAAAKEDIKENYKIAISLDTTGDEDENLLITMDSKHDTGEFPLVIETISGKDPKELLEKIGSKIDEHFEVEAIEKESDSDDDEEEEDESD